MDMSTTRTILRSLFNPSLSNRRIATLNSVSPNTVRNYRRRVKDIELTLHQIRTLDDSELQKLLWPVRRKPSDRPWFDFNQIHKQMQARHQVLMQIWEECCRANPVRPYSYSQFTYFYRQYRASLDISMRQTHYAGEAVYNDFAGQTIEWTDSDTGVVHRAQIYVAVLGCSQYTFCWACQSQQLEHWIDANKRTFEFFGGVPQVVVPDNLKSAVTKPGKELQLNRSYQDMAEHYGCTIVPARVRRPQDKSLAENGVLLISRWILTQLKKRQFFSLTEINDAIAPLLTLFNQRPFRRLPGCRHSRFLELDKPVLQPLPMEPYTFARWCSAQKVPADYHVYVEQHAYSVPYQLVAEKVEAKVTLTSVTFFHKNRQVAQHIRSNEQGGCTTNPNHRPASHRAYAEQCFAVYELWARSVGEHTLSWVMVQFEGRAAHSIAGNRACSQLQQLGKQYGTERLEAACRCACEIGSCTVTSVRSILQCHLDEPAEPLPDIQQSVMHSNVRGASYYQEGL